MESITGDSLRNELQPWIQREGEEEYNSCRAAASEVILEVWETQSRSLDLSSKKLTDLPHALGRFTFLRKFKASCNFLDAIPGYIQDWTELHTLDFFSNLLTELPEWFQTLKHLKILDLRENCLTYQTLAPLKNMASRRCKVYVGGQVSREELKDLNDNAQKIRFVWEKTCCCMQI